MTRLPAASPLFQVLRASLALTGRRRVPVGEVAQEALPSSRQVWRFTFLEEEYAVVGKFFSAYPPRTRLDWGLAREYHAYLRAPALGLTNGRRAIPRLLGRRPEWGLGLLLEAVPGPDLDHFLGQACHQGAGEPLHRALASLAELLAFWHRRPVPESPEPPQAALAYLEKLKLQLGESGLLTAEDHQTLAEEALAWRPRLQSWPEHQVLVHGDATPTNFLFPGGRALALDLERLRPADRLWDLSWVAGELKHAWGWRTQNLEGAEGAIRGFFRAYLAALPRANGAAERLYALNPFYMAMAELRIARNAYLPWDYRRELVAEARRCLAGGRRL